MGKPNGAMGSPFGLTNDTEDMNIPTKYSHLPASEARAKIAADKKAVEDAKIAKQVEEQVAKQVAEIVKKGVVGPTEAQQELASELPEEPQEFGEVSTDKNLSGVYEPDGPPSFTPEDFAALSSTGIMGVLSVKKFNETGLYFESGGITYKIVKV